MAVANLCAQHGFERNDVHIMELPFTRYSIGGELISGPNDESKTIVTIGWLAGKPEGLFHRIAAEISDAVLKSKTLKRALGQLEFALVEQHSDNCYIPGLRLPEDPPHP